MKTIKLLSMMKTIKLLSMLAFAGIVLASCSNDDDPEEVHEEETITTMTVTLTPDAGGTTITLKSYDSDGDGPNDPELTVSGNLTAGATYSGSVTFSNETEDPAEDITEEVEEENTDHQLFYSYTGAIIDVYNLDLDDDGNDLGLSFDLDTDAAGSATLTVSLVHEPTKPNDGTIADAGGSTDYTATFSVSVE
ncbi:type 1 periplasmic binding fold superfamily protein [Maribacter polysaccharolyticus]|uniref:type 1 periplasmic binding fold superfamily protein n=1 Tax=Maribacter polysaccharolyticus TaxID=3020831 RepID=UPI00237F0AA4|nr:type 1 periplasmic binding fold superfamily protein [Maribacter polysaccharolyticus]MDE3740348.1 type 1 periplasmic binding fold superfamily protein [Maribacter polysaccharolyticus]